MSLFDDLNSLDDIDQLIADGVRESETIDYKRADYKISDADYDEIAKDVSAFANSAGGTIIYGVKTRRDKDGAVPEERIPINQDNVARINRAIAAYVRHPVPGIHLKAIPATGTPEVYLVDVPASGLAPHQSIRQRQYFRRNGDNSEPMAHDLVELYFGRRLGPVLVPDLRLDIHAHSRQSEFVLQCSSTLWLRNVGSGTAREVVAAIRLKPGSQSKVSTSANVGGSEFSARAESGGRVRELRAHPQRLVIHPEDDSALLYFHLEMAAGEFWNAGDPGSWVISLSAMAANMRSQRYLVYVDWNPTQDPEFKMISESG